ncbi:MAG: FCD domain-containing protein [Brevundimonas sp.]|uniref:FadR/GntR family transcriptional regulator n=1 Tax=Brevundimonas sp. TaxID=1871086 RepID=UPI00271803FB|nr:FCD domain-containing protein [Brevundimonas sp.]MDO9588548.1 FCD domain-containing protein [Brevundimonas sp.]MDP3370092.1 FCD domain-containing protein [Brevundimonas sp.]MDP3655933.1 FCD domain-containing protein [Brevundimonas sp.]MDZ4111718.1 FCD domain-containing protein [Brevundimonas sp.]
MTEQRLYQTIAARIRALIESGDFPPGSRLPGERDLADRLGVSRVTIREAEIALEAQGWILIKTGSGVYVQPRPATAPGGLPDVTAFDLTAARAVIEAEAAALACAHMTDERAAELEGLVQAMSDPAADDQAALDADRAFHMSIARFAGNPVIEHCIEEIWRMRYELPRVAQVYSRVCHHDWKARADEHSAILSALQRRDAAGARAAMRDHFHRLFEAMLEATETEALAEVRRRTEVDRARFLAAAGL